MESRGTAAEIELARTKLELLEISLRLNKLEPAIGDLDQKIDALEEKIDAETDSAKLQRLDKRFQRLVQKEQDIRKLQLFLLQERSRLSSVLSVVYLPPPLTQASNPPITSVGLVEKPALPTPPTAPERPASPLAHESDDKDRKVVNSLEKINGWECREGRDFHHFFVRFVNMIE